MEQQSACDEIHAFQSQISIMKTLLRGLKGRKGAGLFKYRSRDSSTSPLHTAMIQGPATPQSSSYTPYFGFQSITDCMAPIDAACLSDSASNVAPPSLTAQSSNSSRNSSSASQCQVPAQIAEDESAQFRPDHKLSVGQPWSSTHSRGRLAQRAEALQTATSCPAPCAGPADMQAPKLTCLSTPEDSSSNSFAGTTAALHQPLLQHAVCSTGTPAADMPGLPCMRLRSISSLQHAAGQLLLSNWARPASTATAGMHMATHTAPPRPVTPEPLGHAAPLQAPLQSVQGLRHTLAVTAACSWSPCA